MLHNLDEVSLNQKTLTGVNLLQGISVKNIARKNETRYRHQNIYCLLSFIQLKSKFSYHGYIRYIESLLEILYAKPIATKSVMTPAKMVTIKLVLIT